MDYWRSVLNEVLNKENNEYAFLFTEQGQLRDADQLLSNETPSVLLKEKRDIRTYYLGAQYPGIYFTKREAECMFWLAQGLTILETSKQMLLSPRTVEFYVKNMKFKLKCASKKRLIEKVLKTDLLQQLQVDEGMQVIKH